MNDPQSSVSAWQPLTPRGVAAFASARTGRVWLMQMLAALLLAAVAAWFAAIAWCPVIESALERLPQSGEIRDGQLVWERPTPQWLAEGAFLSLSVDLDHSGVLRSPADVEVELGRATIVFRSLLGEMETRYPGRGRFAFNRPELEPWWGAWKPAILAALAAVTFAGLMLSWQLLAALYAPVVWVVALYSDRDLGWAASCRLAGAALLPGALWLALASAGYSLGVLDLTRWLLAVAAHGIVGWIYLVAGALSAPRRADAPRRKNPFAAPER